MTIVLDINGNPVEAGGVAVELILLRIENAKLKAELAAAQKDSARYLWLRQHPQFMGWDGDYRADEIDTAIDKELAK